MAAASIVYALWLFLPAYVANMSPVLTAKIVPRWKAPIDGGRMHKDGRRVLGDGKTWRGLVGGAVTAGLTALVLAAIVGAAAPSWLDGWDFGASGYTGGPISDQDACDVDVDCAPPTSAPWAMFLFGAIVGTFALTGDIVESYAKRRLGRERGAPWFPFDQLDFVVFALIGYVVAAPLLAAGWVFAALFGDWVILVTIIVGTPLLHLIVNRIGYWLRLKEVPW
jgi:CDP-2,3-bis-(O-geranylgeranyl)-sn-glycerol synthase